ncbi:MAG: hypothetical protein F9K30_00170 [Dechloromonas sp.]|nr:MAG: hypothetical protein F9K30_00170 [Dechloromonas sp.]
MALEYWTDEQILEQLDSGYHWSGPTITYAFPVSANDIYSSDWETEGFRPLTSTQQQYAKLALATWDDVMAATLVQTTSGDSDVEFGFTYIDIDYAHAYYPDAGSVWFSSDYSDLASPQVGRHSFMTYVHEIGHALGLDHMGDYDGDYYWTPSSYQDSTVWSIMSYFGPNWGYGYENGEGLVAWADWVGADGRLYTPQTPMVNDIMAIQSIYGADTTTRTGDTVYGFSSNITGQLASIYNFTLNRSPILTIYDSGGIDTLNLGGWSTASTIDLAAGAYSSCNSMTYNIAIAYGCDIENAVGGSGNDHILGNQLANRLDGGAGNDQLYGLDGNDILDGKAGADTLIGGDGDDIYYIDNLLDVLTETSGTDEVRSTVSHTLGTDFEHLTLLGSAALNATGNAAANILTGNDGANVLDGLAGADTLSGGKGNDTYVIDDAGDVVVENLTALQGGGVDLVRSAISFDLGDSSNGNERSQIENLTLTGSADLTATGNALANLLTGNAGANILDGGLGSDTLKGAAGNDTYRVDLVRNGTTATVKLEDVVSEAAGEGSDTVELRLRDGLDYSFATAVSTLILDAHVEALDADATGTLKLNLTGNALGNTLTGNAAANTLTGLAGDDHLLGGDGNDLLIGGLGLDQLDGGDGSDVFRFDSILNAVTNVDEIFDFTSLTDILQLENGIFTRLAAGNLDAGNFFAGGATVSAQDANDFILYDSDSGRLYYDADANGSSAAIHFATLLGQPPLTHTDFQVT